MNTLSKIPTKIKIFCLVFYTILIFVISLLIINSNSNKEWFTDYTNKPYDENILLNVRLFETRKSAVQTTKEYESSTYNSYITLTKMKDNETISNIVVYIGANTKEKMYKAAESSTTSKGSISSSSTTPYTRTISTVGTKSITKTNNEITKVNEEPVKIFVRVSYSTGTGDNLENHVLKYCTDVTPIKEIEENDFTLRKINTGTTTNNQYITNDDDFKDPFNIKITKKLTDEVTTSKKAVTDSFTLTMMINSHYLDENGLTYGTKAVYNYVPELKVEVFGKVKNDLSDTDNYFSDYVLLNAWYGIITSTRSISGGTVTIDEAYDLNEIYIVSSYLYKDGSCTKGYYKVNVSDLATV